MQLHRTATYALELAAGTSSKVSDQLDFRSEAKTSAVFSLQLQTEV